MNAKIKQLAEQSQLWDRLDPRSLGIPGGSTESRWGEELQEFAELIVKECAEQSMSIGRYNTPSGITPDLAIAIAVGLKKHFGVEE